MPSKHFKIDELLSEADRPAYEEMLRRPANTIDDLWGWLLERGVKVSRDAVWRHRKNEERIMAGVRQAAETARAFGDAARMGGPDLAEANVLRFEQLLMEKLFSADEETDWSPKDYKDLGAAVRGSVASKRETLQLREELEAVKARQASALQAAEKAAQAGGGGGAVVAAIKSALGLGRAA